MHTSTPSLLGGIIPDISYTVALPILAIWISLFAYFNQRFFDAILLLNLWVLGYHHVVSTYSRLIFSKQDIKNHSRLLIQLPILVVAAVYVLYQLFGAALITTIYIYWQWFHYARQSEGIQKSIGSKTRYRSSNMLITRIAFYFLPTAAFLFMLSRGTTSFLGMGLWTIPIPSQLTLYALYVGILLSAWWLITHFSLLLKKQISPIYLLYGIGHFCIFAFAYTAFEKFEYGWLSINIWHNAQYIIFVWLFNKNRFKDQKEVKPSHFLAYISQPKRILIYMGFFIALTSVVYQAIGKSIEVIAPESAYSAMIIVYATINFHHYIVDSIIWKLKKPAVAKHI